MLLLLLNRMVGRVSDSVTRQKRYGYLVTMIVAAIYCFLSADVFAAKVSVWVHPAVVKPDETLTLTVSVEGTMRDVPDFSVLEKDFQLLHRSNNNSVNMKRGSTVIKRNWNVVLLPRAMGQTLIPAINIGDQSTTPLTIEVSNKPAVVHTRNERIFIEVEATPQQPYVNSQVLLAQRLYYSVPLDKAKLSPPVIKDNAAEVVELTTRPAYQRELNGRRYQVIERTYALFPKQSGSMTIEPAEFHGLIPAENNVTSFENFNLYASQQQAKHIISKPLTLRVKARAPAFQAQNWLPASNITLYGKWSITAGSEIQIGDPIHLEMGIVSSGLRSATIPDIKFDLPNNIKVYTEKPTFDFSTAHSGLSGIRKQKITFIATQPAVKKGLVHIPKLRLAWWNTITEQQEEAVLAGISFKVSGTAPVASASESSTATEVKPNNYPYPWWLVLFSTVLVLMIVLAVYRHYRLRAKSVATPSSSLSTPFSIIQLATNESFNSRNAFEFENDRNNNSMKHIQYVKVDKEPEKERMLAKIQFACESANPVKAQQALQQWAEETANINPATLSTIATINADFAQQIAYLSQALYSKNVVKWHGDGLWQAVKQYQTTITVPTSENSGLQDLYPKL